MIHRIRELAASLQGDLLDEGHRGSSDEEDLFEDDDDRGLDLLVKNAVRSNWLEHDPRRVWTQLSARVRGPFGQMAVEEPANAGNVAPVMLETVDANDPDPEVRLRRFVRFSDSMLAQR